MSIIKKVLADMVYQKEKLKTAADNLSRSAIPGEKGKYVEKTFQAMVGPARTHPSHLQGTTHSTPFKTGIDKDSSETDLTGNTINEIKEVSNASEASTAIHGDLSILSKLMDQRNKAVSR